MPSLLSAALWPLLAVALLLGGSRRRAFWLLIALTVHTALGLLADPAPALLHRGIGAAVLLVGILATAGRRWVMGAAVLVACLGLVTQTPLRLVQRFVASPFELRAVAARGGTASDLAGIHEELLRRGEPGIDVALARNRLGEAYAAANTSPLVLETALRLQLVSTEELRAITARAEFSRLFDPRHERLALVLPEHAAWVRALIQSQALKDVARKNLTMALLDAMPDRPRSGALDAFASGCRLLELMPGALDVGELRARAHALLLACWIEPSFGPIAGGGFGDGDETTSKQPSKKPAFATLVTTRQGCEILRRFGVPPGIDLAALRAVLSARVVGETRFFRAPGALAGEAWLGLAHLDGIAGGARGWWLSERDLLGALVLVLLAIWRREARAEASA